MPGILKFAGSRLAFAALTLVAISLVTFLATNVVPADPARVALGKFATPAQVEAYNSQQGLNRPAAARYVSWVGGAVRGDWGTSVLSGQNVSKMVGPRIARSLALAFSAMLIAIPVAFLLGVYSAQRIGKPSDLVVSSGTLLVNSLPEFVVGIALLFVFAVQFGVLPIESSGAAMGTGVDEVKAYVLPVMTLAIVLVPYIARMVRASVRDLSSQPFVRSAALRGVSHRALVWRHVVPNASLPVVNVIALTMAELIAGVVIIETVFGFPGIGQLLVSSVSSKDIPVVQIITLVIGLGFVIFNLLADLAVIALNPRLRSR
jgi:peptide/nickel transport system permease protein